MASQLAEAEALVSLINGLMSISSAFNLSGSGSESRNRIMIINPVTRTMIVIGTNGNGNGEDNGEAPASKVSIDSLKKVEVKNKEEIESIGTECVICMEEFVVGDVAKEMPCQHKFHGECVEKWLKIHGTCPNCRYKMPVDENDDDDVEKCVDIRAEVWVTAGIARSRSDEHDGGDESDSD